jgi:hypothetical protein
VASEFDSAHDFVALLDLKWDGEEIMFWDGAMGRRVLPVRGGRKDEISQIPCIRQ